MLLLFLRLEKSPPKQLFNTCEEINKRKHKGEFLLVERYMRIERKINKFKDIEQAVIHGQICHIIAHLIRVRQNNMPAKWGYSISESTINCHH